MKCKLEEICLFRMEKTNVANLTTKTYISTENMLPNKSGIVNATSLPTVNLTQAFENGDVLVSNIRPYFKKIWKARINGGCSNDVLVFVAKKDIDSDFLYYVLADDAFFAYAMATSKGTKMPRGDKKSIMQYEVPCYDAETQQKIASILKSIDEKIELNNAINNNLLAQVQLIFEAIYSCGDTAKMSDLICEIESGSRPKGGAISQGIPSIGAEKIERFGIYDFSSEKYISEEFFAKLKRGIVKSSDVLLYKDGAYTGKVSMALDGFPHEICTVNEHVFIIRTYCCRFQNYLYCCLSKKKIRDMVFALASSKAAQPGLNQNEVMGIEINLPDEDLLTSFEDTVSPLMHLVALNANENKRLSELRDSLLPKLISGELDVSDIEL